MPNNLPYVAITQPEQPSKNSAQDVQRIQGLGTHHYNEKVEDQGQNNAQTSVDTKPKLAN